MRFVLLLGTALGAFIGISSAGCGSVVVHDSGSAGVSGQAGTAGAGATGQAGAGVSGQAGTFAQGGAAGTGGSSQSSATSVGGGDACGGGAHVEEVFLGDEPCKCESGFTLELESSCGLSVLSYPYRTGASHCDVTVPYAVGNKCKETYFDLSIFACAAPSTSPCITLSVSVGPDGSTSSGLWIDGSGTKWSLSDVQLPGAIPWNGPTIKGTFTAIATSDDGMGQGIKGQYNVCIATETVCPI
jgi:hypothetical protein